MPERINAIHQLPSSQIVFIKPLPGPDSAYAQDFLERIAAICHPIMKSHHLRITTLEEHEPNREFIGRNFNAGEIIQLVLKAQHTGQWLSFRSVQMVMMHELAHCLQMNHGRDFWKVNAEFKNELRALWEKGYTGEGLWGRGRTLLSGEYDRPGTVASEILPRNLCGGAFRNRRRRKRRRGGNNTTSDVGKTYVEKKQRRIAKKFGVNGVALGGDEGTRIKLENGQRVKGNPKVANSGRGRELRVAAALARFGQQQEEQAKKEEVKTENEKEKETEAESSAEEYEEDEGDLQALDLDGSEIRDSEGRGMVKICEDEDGNDEHVKQEMQEWEELNCFQSQRDITSQPDATANLSPRLECTVSTPRSDSNDPSTTSRDSLNATEGDVASDHGTSISNLDLACPICSMSNSASSLTCAVCSHVLNTKKVAGYWRCQSEICKSSQYINAADSGLCGVCGGRKPEAGCPPKTCD